MMALSHEFVTPDGMAMRQTMGHFLTGVAIITTEHESERSGMTISSLTSISLEPPILMISLNFDTRTLEGVIGSGRFAASILGVKQESVARQFASRGGERFADGSFDETPGGLPVITGSLAQLECEVVNDYIIGDHHVVFGQVVHSRDRKGSELVFNAGKFGSFNDFNHDAVPWIF